jgi:ribosomal-protein-alanine N-acetyltransferase
MDRFTITEIEAERDLPAIRELDDATFSSPWTLAMYREFLANRDAAHICVLRTGEDLLAGYCSYMLIVDEIHINNLAVLASLRRRGLGAALIDHVLQAGARQGAQSATLEVRRSNVAARGLYAGAGFVEEGVRRNYYTAPTEDALVLWRRRIGTAGG